MSKIYTYTEEDIMYLTNALESLIEKPNPDVSIPKLLKMFSEEQKVVAKPEVKYRDGFVIDEPYAHTV